MEKKSLPSKQIRTNYGKELYRQGLLRLGFVKDGDFEGGLQIFRKRARRLLKFHDEISDSRKSRIIKWLGDRLYPSTEDALIAMKTRKKDLRQNRR
jgi:hypothetical protein